jgi:hypothetical protein
MCGIVIALVQVGQEIRVILKSLPVLDSRLPW